MSRLELPCPKSRLTSLRNLTAGVGSYPLVSSMSCHLLIFPAVSRLLVAPWACDVGAENATVSVSECPWCCDQSAVCDMCMTESMWALHGPNGVPRLGLCRARCPAPSPTPPGSDATGPLKSPSMPLDRCGPSAI